MSFGSKMKVSAAKIIKNFSAKGFLLKNDDVTDPVTGIESGTKTEITVDYFREYYENYQLIDDRIIGGDAYLLISTDVIPLMDWQFRDADGVKWNIMAITPTEANGVKIIYSVHIRK